METNTTSSSYYSITMTWNPNTKWYNVTMPEQVEEIVINGKRIKKQKHKEQNEDI